MTALITSFADLLDPVTPERFFGDYHHKKPLHIPGSPDKFASIMSWDVINRMLAMDVWNNQTLQLYVDRQQVPPGAYCRRTVNRQRQTVMQPDSERVKDMLRRGASLLLNEIETLHPGTLAVVETIRQTLGAKVSANLYCSWQERQAFDSHYDRHDVYVLHVHGEKSWRVYEGRADNPIEHAAFYNIPQADYDRMKGKVALEPVVRPGDLLYLPRGQFHDALATSEASVHVTFACSEPTGLDWLTQLWEQAVQDSGFRAYLPRDDGPDGEAALRAHLERLLDTLRRKGLEGPGLDAAKALQAGFGIKRGAFNLPDKGGGKKGDSPLY